ncbi:carbohydrate esterase family 3 protein [Teratosphaeria destructans]|uniref:Carbohydrate esterase family 3 protein n=1 Tax=Teratosphaeria destructans TaxID=418781 RepID=A0A9W7T1B2_9PEZI|nr:carbohydrate esterase family 3 protein [Teratosphaeria destructans]
MKSPIVLPILAIACVVAFLFTLRARLLPSSDPASSSGSADDSEQRTPLRLLAIGDSLTEGVGSTASNGWRQQLSWNLTNAGNAVEFIGSLRHGNFSDNAHAGYGGKSISEITPFVIKDIFQHPDVVLLLAGTNDMMGWPRQPWESAPMRLGILMDKVLKENPEATLLVGRIPHCKEPIQAARVDDFNAALDDVVDSRLALGHKVLLVDMSEVGVDGAYLHDQYHPNDPGYAIIAARWLEGLRAASDSGWITPPII